MVIQYSCLPVLHLLPVHPGSQIQVPCLLQTPFSQGGTQTAEERNQTDGNMSAFMNSCNFDWCQGQIYPRRKGWTRRDEGREASYFCVFHAEHSGMDMYLKLQLMIKEVALCRLYGVHF